MLARASAGIVGVTIVGCLVHSAILTYAGGFDSPTAPMMIGLALGLVVGSAVVGICWRQRRVALAILIGTTIVAGEAYNLVLTAERTVAQREMRQAPLIAADVQRSKAMKRIAVADAAAAAIGDTPRLLAAQEARKAADASVVEKAAERGCATNCRALLEQQVTKAQEELEAARKEIAQAKFSAAVELASAKAAFAAMPAFGSATPLADRLGVEQWKIDLLAAALASIAANGLAAFLIAFAAHGRENEVRAYPETKLEITPPVAKRAPGRTLKRDPMEEADQFAREVLKPSPDGRVVLADVWKSYHAWCQAKGLEPFGDQEIGKALHLLFSAVGLRLEGAGAAAALVGITWIERIALSPPNRT